MYAKVCTQMILILAVLTWVQITTLEPILCWPKWVTGVWNEEDCLSCEFGINHA